MSWCATSSVPVHRGEAPHQTLRALEVALQPFRKGSADFADCLHVALATQAGEQPLWTFHKGASKISGARLLAKA
jgi:predicted nucleic-acid-binding protein